MAIADLFLGRKIVLEYDPVTQGHFLVVKVDALEFDPEGGLVTIDYPHNMVH